MSARIPATPERASLLERTAIELDDPELAPLLGDLQGNILKSQGRDNAVHAFVRFRGPPGRCRAWLRAQAPEITSAPAQAAQARDHARNGAWHPFTNLMLSASGYRALGIEPDAQPSDAAFRAGMKDLRASCYDDPATGRPLISPLCDRLDDWEPPFREQIDALVMVAYGGVDLEVDAARAFLERRIDALRTSLDGVGEVIHVEHGHVLRDAAGRPIEHFGFADGISNPLFLADDLEQARRDDGCARYDLSAPLSLVLVPEPRSTNPHACGSYFVYRKLQQNIRGFHRRIDALAAALSSAAGGAPIDRELAGAYVMGRFEDGTPVVDHPSAEAGRPTSNFNYDGDPTGMRCPFHAHTRKTNPRGDLVRAFGVSPEEERARRIVRRAISYGPADLEPAEEWTDAGLLFLCAVGDIAGQFITQQSGWCNRTAFLHEETGLDPVVGCSSPGDASCPQSWPVRWGQPEGAPKLTFDFSGFLRCRGGEYFFAPSLSFLREL